MPHSIRIGCLGEVMLELVLKDENRAGLGVAGDTYNTAVYLAQSDDIEAVDYITVLGCDSFSDRIRSHMAAHHVSAGRVLTHPTRIPGLYAIETDEQGERSFTYWRSASAVRCLGDEGLTQFDDLFEGLTHLYYSGISLAVLSELNRAKLFEALARFRQNGGIVAFDSNYRPRLWANADVAREQTERAWRSCDIGLPSVDDEMALFEDHDEAAVLARFAQYGLSCGGLKRGGLGPVGLDGTQIVVPDAVVRVVDTTAAGDSFNAAFLTSYLTGGDTATALLAGHRLASAVIGHRGAIMPKAGADV